MVADSFSVTIRPMCAVDIDAVSSIEQRVSPHPWTRNQFAESLASSHHGRVLEIEGEIAGFFLYSLVSGEAEILDIAVSPGFQGRGLGRLLLNRLIELAAEQAETLFLEVRESNVVALNLYFSAGFNQVGERRNYYKMATGNENALILGRYLGA